MKKVQTQKQQKPQAKKAQPKAKVLSENCFFSMLQVITIDDGKTTDIRMELGGNFDTLIYGLFSHAKQEPSVELFLTQLVAMYLMDMQGKSEKRKNNECHK